eukprot:1195964-Prorocentrum_minimum.AAC.4
MKTFALSSSSSLFAVSRPATRFGNKSSVVWPIYFQINGALQEEMKDIHALSIKKCITPEQHQNA